MVKIKSGIKYIKWNESNESWVINITIDGVKKYLGCYKSLEDAKDKLISCRIPVLPCGINRKYSINEDYFKLINSSEKDFWIGFICADGSIKSNRKSFCLKITQANDVLMKKFKEDIMYTGNINFITKKQNGRYSDKPFYELTIYNSNFAKDILNLGKTRLKKDQVEIPHGIPNEYTIDFIRGYFEGDGSLYLCNSNSNSNLSWGFGISGEILLLEKIKNHIQMGNIYKDKSIGVLSAVGNIQIHKFIDMLYYSDDTYGIKHLKYRSLTDE